MHFNLCRVFHILIVEEHAVHASFLGHERFVSLLLREGAVLLRVLWVLLRHRLQRGLPLLRFLPHDVLQLLTHLLARLFAQFTPRLLLAHVQRVQHASTVPHHVRLHHVHPFPRQVRRDLAYQPNAIGALDPYVRVMLVRRVAHRHARRVRVVRVQSRPRELVRRVRDAVRPTPASLRASRATEKSLEQSHRARRARARPRASRVAPLRLFIARASPRASDALDASRARPRAVARASDVRSRVARVVAPASSRVELCGRVGRGTRSGRGRDARAASRRATTPTRAARDARARPGRSTSRACRGSCASRAGTR